MRHAFAGIDLAPIIPIALLLVLALLALLLVGFALWRRGRGAWWRAAAFALLLLAMANPRLVEESRAPRPDIALLLVDQSASTSIGDRAAQIATARRLLEDRARALPDLELRIAEVPEDGNQGTRLFTAMEHALADIPRGQLAGVIALSDGQVHDAPATPLTHSPLADAPLHLLLPGRPGETDRHLRILEAPGFGIVGRGVELRVMVEDLGTTQTGTIQGGSTRLTIRRDNAPPRTEMVPIGREHRITLPMERGGPAVVELSVEERPGEVSTRNNRAVIGITGVRDRLRVLLVSGEPHAGERTWRRLLKADPGVDLVHFTILRPPEKDDLTPLHELSLIAFPVRELFQVKLREFDLIVFDRFSNRSILPPAYLRNIADYVRTGGALLLSVGPEFASPASLATTPLGAVLPALPVGRDAEGIIESPFRPRVTATGARHPVTEGLPGANTSDRADPSWGRWYRALRAEPRSGATVLEASGAAPLLQLDRVGEGRVALLLSDQIWLWSRGHDGGGPQAELLRRIAHWLMREPELEEEELLVRIEAGRLTIERRSLAPSEPPEITVTAPDGSTSRHRLQPGAGGRAMAELPATAPGLWQVTDGTRTAFAAAAITNPAEFMDLRADPARMQPLVQATGGGVHWLGSTPSPSLPELRRVALGRDAAGNGWIGLRRNGDHTVTGIAALPLLPPWLALPLVLGAAVLGWRRESR